MTLDYFHLLFCRTKLYEVLNLINVKRIFQYYSTELIKSCNGTFTFERMISQLHARPCSISCTFSDLGLTRLWTFDFLARPELMATAEKRLSSSDISISGALEASPDFCVSSHKLLCTALDSFIQCNGFNFLELSFDCGLFLHCCNGLCCNFICNMKF